MRMSQKMIILFSLMAIMTTLANSLYFINLEMDALETTTANNLTAVGEKMVDEIEQYVLMMDYAMETMTSNAKFMESMHLLDQLGNDADIVSAQTTITQALYHSPINGRFYRVSIFNKNGLYISSQFENTGMVESLSDEARDIVQTMPWLAAVEKDVYHSHLIPPHRDPWYTAKDKQVFSAIRAAVWRGKVIGYLEVTTHAGDLEKIFSVSSLEGVNVQALFCNNDILFKKPDDPMDYSGMALNGIKTLVTPGGDDLLVVMLESKPLGLRLYISQAVSIHKRTMQDFIWRYASTIAVILTATIFIIILFSVRLTNSVRRLTKKVRTVSVDDMLHLNGPLVSNHVTSHGDLETRELENVFNELTQRLKVSMNNEITMRQANLHAQLDALQAQINPHFIYNTLNIISAKGMECGNEEIIHLCDQFAQMLRYSTNLQNTTTSLGDEMTHMLSYLGLCKARYEDRLTYYISIPDDAYGLVIPKLMLQPLVENAIKHGYSDLTPNIHIDVSAKHSKDGLCLTIRDNGQGFSPQALEKLDAAFKQIISGITYDQEGAAGHIGLANTFMRLTYYSGGRIPMKLYNDSGAVIELIIPYGKEDLQ